MAKKFDPNELVARNFRYYSIFPLDLHVPEIIDTPPFRPKIRAIENELTNRLGTNTVFYNFHKANYFRMFAYRCWLCKSYPDIWDDRPTVAEFKKEVIAFKRFAQKRPKLIPDIANFLDTKYGNLSHVSDEYRDWFLWLPKLQMSPIWWSYFANNQHKNKKEAVEFADILLSAIPKNLTQGRPPDVIPIWIARHLDILWRSAGYNPLNSGESWRLFISQLQITLNIIGKDSTCSKHLINRVRLSLQDKPHTGLYREKPAGRYPTKFHIDKSWEIPFHDGRSIACLSNLSGWELLLYYGAKISLKLKCYKVYRRLFSRLTSRHASILLRPISRPKSWNGELTPCTSSQQIVKPPS